MLTCQDFLLFADERETLWAWRAVVVERLARLRLTIHDANAQVKPVTHGIPFLGFVVYPTHRGLKRRKGIVFARRMRAHAAALRATRASFASLTTMVRGWVNHVRYGDTRRLRRAVLRRV